VYSVEEGSSGPRGGAGAECSPVAGRTLGRFVAESPDGENTGKGPKASARRLDSPVFESMDPKRSRKIDRSAGEEAHDEEILRWAMLSTGCHLVRAWGEERRREVYSGVES